MKYLGPTQSGSENGTTASRNRFGQYFRRRAVPVQPRTAAQLAVRARMSNNAAAWRALTDAQRAAWESLGTQITRKIGRASWRARVYMLVRAESMLDDSLPL